MPVNLTEQPIQNINLGKQLAPDLSGFGQGMGALLGGYIQNKAKTEQDAAALEEFNRLQGMDIKADELVNNPEFVSFMQKEPEMGELLASSIVSGDEREQAKVKQQIEYTAGTSANLLSLDQKGRVAMLKKLSADAFNSGVDGGDVEAEEWSRLASLALKDPQALDFELKQMVGESGNAKKFMDLYGVGGGVDQTQINYLRTSLDKKNTDFNKVEQAYTRIKKIGTTATAASDMALIFNYMKMLDPGSTVREGEFATAQNAAGAPERVVNLYNNMMKGTRMGVEQRKDFMGRAADLFSAAQESADKNIKATIGMAQQDNLPVERVLGKGRLKSYNEREKLRAPDEEKQKEVIKVTY